MRTHKKVHSKMYDDDRSVTGHKLIKTNNVDRREMLNADPQLFLAPLLKTVERMKFLLNNLELSNLHQTMATQSINIDQVIHTILNKYNSIIREEGINVTLSLEQQVPFHGDANNFSTVLSQLIANAIHFRDPKKNVMTIQLHVEVLPSVCTVQIHDNGIGISDAIRPNIFNLFYRGSDRSAGTGIGLYIVKEVLNKMGGAIMVKSVEHEESTFRVSIPNLIQ